MWIWKCLQRMVYFSEKNLFEICIIFQWLAAKNENAWISNYFHAVSIKRYHKRKLLMTQKLISGISFCLFEFSIGVFAMHSTAKNHLNVILEKRHTSNSWCPKDELLLNVDSEFRLNLLIKFDWALTNKKY